LKFTAVPRSFLVSGPAVDASCAALGAWLRLQSYVSSDGVENPVITGARDWPPRKWLVMANLERGEVDSIVAAGLAVWRETNLEVLGFDFDGLATVESRRRGGRAGGRGRPQGTAQEQVSDSSPTRPRTAQEQVSDSSSEPLSSPLPPLPLPSLPSQEEISELAQPPASEPPFLTFPCAGTPGSWALTTDQVAQWHQLFPALDVEQQCRSALAWVDANPGKQKTPRGMKGFLARWLERSQNKGIGDGRRGPVRDVRVGHAMAEVTPRVSGEVRL
jgi:hypothetical protein